jgi:hypothetical protein
MHSEWMNEDDRVVAGFASTVAKGASLAVPISDRPGVLAQALAVFRGSGVALSSTRTLRSLGAPGAVMGRGIYVLDLTAADDDSVERALMHMKSHLDATNSYMLALFDRTHIDNVASWDFESRAALLCDPDDHDWAVALTAAKAAMGNRLNDTGRDGEAERLRRLNEEVARIAERLGDLAKQSSRLAPGDDASRKSEAVTSGEVRVMIRARRLREQIFDAGLFADPAWDMLLDLFAAELEEKQISVSSLCVAAAVPSTTALRWIGILEKGGLVERRAAPEDRRKSYLFLTEVAWAGMSQYFQKLRELPT